MSVHSFEVLGIPPTLDAAEMKRGYFAALARHPPHVDPEGFRRLRSAYEALSRPGGLVEAYLSAPFDARAELARFKETFDARLAEAGEEHRRRLHEQQGSEKFAELFSGLAWWELPG